MISRHASTIDRDRDNLDRNETINSGNEESEEDNGISRNPSENPPYIRQTVKTLIQNVIHRVPSKYGMEGISNAQKDNSVLFKSCARKSNEALHSTEYEYDNKNGDVTEEKIYDDKGHFKKKISTEYNMNKDKTIETTYDSEGKLIEKTQHGYNAKGERAYEITMDDKGKMIKKSIYAYDKNGLKTEKKTTNEKGEVISIKKYTYEY